MVAGEAARFKPGKCLMASFPGRGWSAWLGNPL